MVFSAHLAFTTGFVEDLNEQQSFCGEWSFERRMTSRIPSPTDNTQVIDDTKITTEWQQILVKANYGQSCKQMLSVGIWGRLEKPLNSSYCLLSAHKLPSPGSLNTAPGFSPMPAWLHTLRMPTEHFPNFFAFCNFATYLGVNQLIFATVEHQTGCVLPPLSLCSKTSPLLLETPSVVYT